MTAQSRFSEEAWPAPRSPVSAAWSDIISGAAKSWLWMALAFQDIKLRYRGSVLGPFWLTISTVVMVASMGVIYSTLFNISAKHLSAIFGYWLDRLGLHFYCHIGRLPDLSQCGRHYSNCAAAVFRPCLSRRLPESNRSRPQPCHHSAGTLNISDSRRLANT